MHSVMLILYHSPKSQRLKNGGTLLIAQRETKNRAAASKSLHRRPNQDRDPSWSGANMLKNDHPK